MKAANISCQNLIVDTFSIPGITDKVNLLSLGSTGGAVPYTRTGGGGWILRPKRPVLRCQRPLCCLIPSRRFLPAVPMMRWLCSMFETRPTVAMHSDDTCTSRLDGSRITHWSPCRRSSTADTPADRTICAPQPGYFSTQQTRVPSGSEPSGWLSPSTGRTVHKNTELHAEPRRIELNCMWTNKPAVYYIYRVGHKKRTCLSIDNSAMVTHRKASYMSKALECCRQREPNLHSKSFKYSLPNLHKSSLPLKLGICTHSHVPELSLIHIWRCRRRG